MSPRVTRSSARLSAGSSNTANSQSPSAALHNQPPPPSRKRKAPQPEPGPEPASVPADDPPKKRTRRARVVPVSTQPAPLPASVPPKRRKQGKDSLAMSATGPSPGPSQDEKHTEIPVLPSKRTSTRKKTASDLPPPSATPPLRRTRKVSSKADQDVVMKDAEGNAEVDAAKPSDNQGPSASDDNTDEDAARQNYDEGEDDDEDDYDPFESSYLGRPSGSTELSSTLRALSGMMSGVSSRLRGILENLKQKGDPSVQLIALQDLSEILLVSTEDNLAGHFSPDHYVKELVALMQPNESGEENPEIMLLACRCIANLMEALPSSTASVVYGGAVPILCQKLLEIHFIDLAEQSLSTLEKISVEFPASIVREGGLTACLTYLDFFPTSTQRTAVTTAANCCRNLPEDSFAVVRDVMPILLGVLNSNDQRVVEQGCLCVSRVVESFKYKGKLEDLVSTDLLRAILRLLLPGTTNLIGPNIHTQFLRVLSITARASPRLSAELFKMSIVDTLYQILSGVSPPSGTEDLALKIDSVVIMQALIHRPREQVFETLNVICELLPAVQKDGLTYLDDLFDDANNGDDFVSRATSSKKALCQQRLDLLEGCEEEVKRFAMIILPTLTEAFSSTVNLSVRQKVLVAQLKMLFNLKTDILMDALRPVPYASFLASILSQQDHPTLVTYALQAAELLLKRLGSVYRYQFYREGVMSEISKLAARPCKTLEAQPVDPKPSAGAGTTGYHNEGPTSSEEGMDLDHDMDEHNDEYNSEEDNEDDEQDDDPSDSSPSSSEHGGDKDLHAPNAQDTITMRAKKFIDIHETDEAKAMGHKASATLESLKGLADAIKSAYLQHGAADGLVQFARLAGYFDENGLESITSYELLNSGIVEVLLEVFSAANPAARSEARSAFLVAFMGSAHGSKSSSKGSTGLTPFTILVNKLQDLLSRAEHFEVITVHHNTFDSNRSSATSMLAKQLRLKLIADDESGIPRQYRNVMVSIHAIATFKALDEYLRPRISLAERPRGSKKREGMPSAIAAYAAALAGRTEADGTPSGSGSNIPTDATNRSVARKHPKTRSGNPSTQAPPSSSNVVNKPIPDRKSMRRFPGQTEVTPLPPSLSTPRKPMDKGQEPLECADETQLSDEDDVSDDGALSAIVKDLEEEMDGSPPDPSAVNVEVAATGKVIARQEDGTRISTPMQNVTASGPSSTARANTAQQGPSTPTSSTRPVSYAAAIQSTPQDWHIEFTVDDKPISQETTIYRAVHFNPAQQTEVSSRNVWAAVHTIKFKRVAGPPSTESKPHNSSLEGASTASADMPQSLKKNPATSGILQLLGILHDLNANIEEVVPNGKNQEKLAAEPLSQFVNTKLTAKLNRQLEEPLIVASNCLPSWSEDLARFYPFLFPFETRHLFLQSTSFGYSRSMTRWQSAQSSSDSRHDHYHRDDRPFLGRLQRQKVRISRTRILESAIKVMELYGSSPSILEVEYFEEVGTGLGPTLEFYSTISKEFSKKKLKLWRENESFDNDEYAFGKRGLFPAPMSDEQMATDNGKRVLHLFRILGKFVARSMLDSRIIDVSFNPMFFRVGNSAPIVAPSLGAVGSVDTDLARALRLLVQFANAKREIDEDATLSSARRAQAAQGIEIGGTRIDDLCLDFTLPGYPHIQLQANGSSTPVTIENVGLYVERVLDMTLGSGVQKQVHAFRAGFSQVFPYSALRAFTPDELVMLFGRVDEDWSLETLMDSIKADHGYNLESRSVRNLLQTMSELSPSERRDFLQFVTGSPKLPIGGFKSLTPMFTVVCKPSEPPYTSDDYLPSVMTCVNYLKMPDYSDLSVLRERLNMAIREGQGAFHLS